MNTILKLFFSTLVIVSILSSCNESRVTPTESNNDLHIALLVTHGFHGEETYMPIGYLVNKGFQVTVIGPEVGRVESWDRKYNILIEKSISDVTIEDFDALIIPGGSAPVRMREVPEAVDYTIDFYYSGKVVASICHGPQLLTVTGILDGVNATGVSDIKEEMEIAGANYIDEAVVVHNNLITSREPDDIPSFIIAIEKALN